MQGALLNKHSSTNRSISFPFSIHCSTKGNLPRISGTLANRLKLKSRLDNDSHSANSSGNRESQLFCKISVCKLKTKKNLRFGLYNSIFHPKRRTIGFACSICQIRLLSNVHALIISCTPYMERNFLLCGQWGTRLVLYYILKNIFKIYNPL